MTPSCILVQLLWNHGIYAKCDPNDSERENAVPPRTRHYCECLKSRRTLVAHGLYFT